MGRLQPRFKSHAPAEHGALRPIFMTPRCATSCPDASRALARGGLLAFTVESHDGDGFVMGEGRRYAHGARYVRASIETAGLAVLQLEQQSIRTERGVPGLVVVAEKP
ncbi:MAG: hypothetical protein QOH32_2490 [Bradyrhizobium sp.]|nr:hypothetical protein [Bradyrhizobium sp.]